MKTTIHDVSISARYLIAIVEHDGAMGEALATWVNEMGHTAVCFASGTDLLNAVRKTEFSLFLLDGGPADIEGIDLVKQLRSFGPVEAPIILCTPPGREAEVVDALRLGADDFIVKPVRRHELAARVGAVLRRAYPPSPDHALLVIPPFSIDLANRAFYVDGRIIELQNREYALALLLFQNLNGVVPRARIIQSLWGSESLGTSRSLDTHVSHIRRKLGLGAGCGLILQSVYGIGYRLRVRALPPRRED